MTLTKLQNIRLFRQSLERGINSGVINSISNAYSYCYGFLDYLISVSDEEYELNYIDSFYDEVKYLCKEYKLK